MSLFEQVYMIYFSFRKINMGNIKKHNGTWNCESHFIEQGDMSERSSISSRGKQYKNLNCGAGVELRLAEASGLWWTHSENALHCVNCAHWHFLGLTVTCADPPSCDRWGYEKAGSDLRVHGEMPKEVSGLCCPSLLDLPGPRLRECAGGCACCDPSIHTQTCSRSLPRHKLTHFSYPEI